MEKKNFYRRIFCRSGLVGTVLPLGLLSHTWAASEGETGADSATFGLIFDQQSEAMALAVKMRQIALDSGDQGYGAIVVRDNQLIGWAPSRVVTNHDPTAHAETEAIRDASRNLSNRNLNGSIMYSTSHPCPMCEAAAYWAGIDRMIYGSDMVDAGAPSLSRCR